MPGCAGRGGVAEVERPNALDVRGVRARHLGDVAEVELGAAHLGALGQRDRDVGSES